MIGNIYSWPPSPITPRMPEPEWKASKEYLGMRFHKIQSRDQGYVELKENHMVFQCADIWLKNKFRLAS